MEENLPVLHQPANQVRQETLTFSMIILALILKIIFNVMKDPAAAVICLD